MLYLILITFVVFLLFWLGDLYLTLKIVKHLGHKVEVNPFIKFILKGRGKLIFLFKPLELFAFLYLIWFLNNFNGVIHFYILLVFIMFYAILVINNAHVYYKATGKESLAFKFIVLGLVISMLFFIYLNYLLYVDLGTAYDAVSQSNDKYNDLYWQCQENNISVVAKEPANISQVFPDLDLPIRRANIK
jgi:hypothetical protein